MQNKVVFITGASSGIGAACAEKFASQGSKLLLCARRLDKLNALAHKLEKTYQISTYTFQLDVSDKNAIKKSLTELPTSWQKIDLLVNNAGFAIGMDHIANGNPDDWDKVIDTNLKGLLNITHAVLPNMIKKKEGHIINISSIAGHNVYPGGAVYCATKHAVGAITKALRIETLGTGVKISTIDPGMVETEFSVVRFSGDTERAKTIYAGMTPLKAEDIADAILYCASTPRSVNIAEITVMPLEQASVLHVHREN